MATIIVSYRRSDSDVIAGRIRDRLATSFGNDSVYMDIDSIPFGLDFREHIKKALLQTEALVVVIGPNWIGQREDGARISDETDPVRIEVETALQRNIPVIPVLIGGANMPKPSELPDGLRDLAFRNAAIVDGGRDFHQHMDRLIRSIEKTLAEPNGSHDTRVSIQQRDAHALTKGHTDKKNSSANWLTISLVAALAAASGTIIYLLVKQQPSLPQISAPAGPIQQSSNPAHQPQVQSAATTTGEVLPTVPPPCNRNNRNDAFFDDFKTQQVGWNPPVGANISGADGKIASYRGEGLALEVPPTKTFTELYTPMLFSAVNVCVHIKTPPNIPERALVSAGIVFWSQNLPNGNNAYAVSIFLEPASAQIYRNVDGNWIGVGMAESSLVNTQSSATNELQVLTKGDYGAYYVNGSKLGEFKGQPPNKAFTGILAQSGAKQKLLWTFLDFSVSENN